MKLYIEAEASSRMLSRTNKVTIIAVRAVCTYACMGLQPVCVTICRRSGADAELYRVVKQGVAPGGDDMPPPMAI